MGRVTRSMWDGLQIIKAVIDAGAAIKVLDRSYIDLTTPMGRGFMAMMSAMAEDERLRIIKRTHEGRQIARAKGVRMGRKPKLTPHQIKEARQRRAKGERPRHLTKSYGVSVSTISRPLDFCVRARQANGAQGRSISAAHGRPAKQVDASPAAVSLLETPRAFHRDFAALSRMEIMRLASDAAHRLDILNSRNRTSRFVGE